jgi:hypothetical protein
MAQAPEDVLVDPFVAAGRAIGKGGALVARMMSGKHRKRDEKRRRGDSDDEHPNQSQGDLDGYSEDGCYCCDAGHDKPHRHGNDTFASNGCWCCFAGHPHPHDPYENCQHPRQRLPPPDPSERDNHLSSPYSPNRTSSAITLSLPPTYGGHTMRQACSIPPISNPPRYPPSRIGAPPSEHPSESNILSYPPTPHRGGWEQQNSAGYSSWTVPQQVISQHLYAEPLPHDRWTQPPIPSSSTSNDPRNSSAHNSRVSQPPSAYNRRSVAFGTEGNIHSALNLSDSRPLDDRRSTRTYSYAGISFYLHHHSLLTILVFLSHRFRTLCT